MVALMKAARWLSLLVSLTVIAPLGCDDAKKDEKESESKRKRKKKKKKKRKDDGETKSAKDESKTPQYPKIAWVDGDFGDAKARNDVLDMSNTSCNQLINACLACGKRITTKREDANFSFGVHAHIFDALKAKSASDRAKVCPGLHKTAKAASDDCIAGCRAVKKELTGKD